MTLRNEETCQQLDPAPTGRASPQLSSTRCSLCKIQTEQSGAEENPFWPCLPSCNSTQRYSEQTLQLQQLLGWPFVGFCFVLIREGDGGGNGGVGQGSPI